MALSGPVDLVATTLSSSSVALTWINLDVYNDIQMWRLKATLDFGSGSVEPQVDEVLTGNASGKTAKVVEVIQTGGVWGEGTAEGYIHLKDCNGAFQDGEAVDGDIGGASMLTVDEPTAPPGAYALIGSTGGHREYTKDVNLDPNTRYYWKLKGVVWEPPDESDFSGEVYATTYGVLDAPTDLVALAFSNFIEVTFKDNSGTEDDHRLYRKVGAGPDWNELDPIPPNMDYYRDTVIVAGTTYTYKARAKEGTSYSGYSNEDSAVAISKPAAPTLLVKSNVQDKSIRLSWKDNATNETGFKIEIGIDVGFGAGKVDRVVGANVTSFLVTGLTPSTQYWFRVRAYNGVGNSGYSNIVTDTTLADGVYVPTKFEKWIRSPNIEPIYLVEIYTKMDLTGFEEHDHPCYRKTIGASDRGIDILEVFEDGEAYEKKDTPVQVKANVNTFHFDYNARILYVHATGDVNPEGSGLLLEGAFWLYFSTHKNIEFTANERLQHFLPLLTKEGIPSIMQEIKRCFEGSFNIASGSITFINGKVGGAYFFDTKYATYTWENSKLAVKAGKDDFAYADFKTILTSFIDEKRCNDSGITFTLRDLRQEMERNLILTKFTEGSYPELEEDFLGEPIPLCFGAKYNVVAVPIDVIQRKYKFHDGRSKSVNAVYKNWGAGSTPLTEDTDYFVDLQRSIITFKRDDFELGPEDIVEVFFIGSTNSADEPIENGAEVFKYLMNEHYALLNSELNLDSIYRSKYENTAPLSIFLYKDTPYREIVRTIEHSMEAFTFQDTEGRLGLKPQLSVAESNAKYIRNHQIFNHLQSKARSELLWKVNVFYDENPQSQEWQVKSAQDDDILHRYKISNELKVYSYFSAPFSAQSLATNILAMLNKETIKDTLPMLLFDVMPGDIVKFSRTRFYDSDGTASEINLRIIRISKSPASGQTTITAEVVPDA